jgi:hypothetical protein
MLEKNDQINFLNKIDNPQQIKKFITNLILMTDVAQHFKNLDQLKTINNHTSIQGLASITNQ